MLLLSKGKYLIIQYTTSLQSLEIAKLEGRLPTYLKDELLEELLEVIGAFRVIRGRDQTIGQSD